MNLIVCDDDQLVALSLKTILEADSELAVVASGNDGKDAVALYEKYHPDVVLMDIQMKKMSGLCAAEEILKKDTDAKILLLTTFSDDEYIMKALELGVKGYILKQDFNGIVPAVKAVYGGQSVFGGEIVSKIPVLTTKKESFDYAVYDITDKEIEVIAEVGSGKSNREIADALCLSEGTVRNYISTILEKLSLRDRTQLAVFYLNHR
ncbi:response regulator transcription factor [Agathobacter ruminis]|uniref:Stage 0 sporulation protein A homolog n=1 Tax=Agathobacter ruminis TaxID=1712665 RepID=A0A2G3E583_9FIRM|nr:response regulator transcription factor [Agathobacter ruminis]MDC7301108.1 response regulator transcription factor [Agathobacter ruminis]PHU38429.1 DNA-binding response regulator [Agathobacter ruminis]